MGSLNKMLAIGNLGRDAELRYTAGGQAVASFSLAATETWTDKDGARQERTEWIRCVLWGKQAETLQPYLAKGKQVHVEGRLQTRKWQDKDGHDRYTTEVNVQRVVLLGGGGEGAARPARAMRQAAADDEGFDPEPAATVAEAPALSEDDIPF